MTAETGTGEAPVGSAFDAALLACPHSGYARLRAQEPVLRTIAPSGAPVVLVTRYEDVRAALIDPRLSLSKDSAAGTGGHGPSMPPELDAHLLNMDPPDHTRLRALIAGAFTVRRVQALRPQVQQRTDALLDRFTGARADLMADLAAPLAMTVICDVLGVEEEHRPDFRRWTDTLNSPAADAAVASRQALGHMYRFLRELVAAKRGEPADDLLSALVRARDQGDRLTEAELVSLAFLLLFAGYDNSANLIGNTIVALLSHPEHHAGLRKGRLSMEQVLTETLRWSTPSMLASRRFPSQDMPIGGVEVAAGERVWLSLASANRDPDRFPEPDRFDPGRAQGGHLALGHGIHACLGAGLARMEAAIAVQTLLSRFPTLQLTTGADVEWVSSFRNRGPAHLLVTW